MNPEPQLNRAYLKQKVLEPSVVGRVHANSLELLKAEYKLVRVRNVGGAAGLGRDPQFYELFLPGTPPGSYWGNPRKFPNSLWQGKERVIPINDTLEPSP